MTPADEREALAETLEWHLPESYGDHGCALRCGWSDEGTTDSAGEHLADALAPLIARARAQALRDAAETIPEVGDVLRRMADREVIRATGGSSLDTTSTSG